MYFLIAQKRVHAKCFCQQMINFHVKNRSSRGISGLTLGISATWISWCYTCVFSKISEGETGACACRNIPGCLIRYQEEWSRTSPALLPVSLRGFQHCKHHGEELIRGWCCTTCYQAAKVSPNIVTVVLTWDKGLALLVEAGKSFSGAFPMFLTQGAKPLAWES